MFGASDLKLALAISDAGAFPSYMIPQDEYGDPNLDALYTDIREFTLCTGHTNILVGGIGQSRLNNINLLRMLVELKVSHIELFDDEVCGDLDQAWNTPQTISGIKFLKKQFKVLARIFNPKDYIVSNYFDALCLKGQESAGKSGSYSVTDLFDLQKNITPNIGLVPYGGIGSPTQVQNYISQGAASVAIGTLFAACVESPLSDDVKLKMVGLTSKDIVKIPDTNQNSIIFSEISPNNLPTDPSDWNRGTYLRTGLKGDASQGLIYVGTGIDYVTKIRTVKETVEYLVQDLN